ncbi:DASH complex subunit ask1 [Oleoguttula sp. CCFEE 5521]
MSRPSDLRNRTLTLTEELERLEQQITLTLQEIDGNFSKAHRIVTGSILPIVEQYAKHSGNVWEGSKFWKHFFEASANVSLSGYEEGALDDEQVTQTEDATEEGSTLRTPQQDDQNGSGGRQGADEDDSFTVDSPTQVTGVQSTPKLTASTGKPRSGPSSQQRTKAGKRTTASFRSPSPRKYTGRNPLALTDTPSEPSTPRPQQTQLDSSPFQPQSGNQSSAQRTASREQNADAFLHRNVLDKHYRVQATPHTQRRERVTQQTGPTPGAATNTIKQPWDDSPQSSPEISAPQLRSDLFSPAPPRRPTELAPRTPGLSILTPARTKATAPKTSTGRSLFSPETARTSAFSTAASDSEDDNDDFGMSPPKTMQFHVPQSRLLQTPAREASKRIVADLLMTAGAEDTDEIEGIDDGREEEESPSLVKKGWNEDDTF